MNCKPGDLAVIVDSAFAENVGLLVSVLAAADSYEGEPHWTVRSVGSPIKFEWYEDGQPTGELGFDMQTDSPDADMRPIRDPGDDAVDETLLRLPAPSKEVKPCAA